MSIIEKRWSQARTPAFALVMESDLDLSAMIRTPLQLDGHRVECVADRAFAIEKLLALVASDMAPRA